MNATRRERRIHKRAERQAEIQQQRATYRKRQRNKRVINYAVIALIVLGGAYAIFQFALPEVDVERESLARCLTESGVIMYGTDWCPHCQEQKRRFGDAFRYVNYINCDLNREACDLAGVTGYPTWVFPNGQAVSGEQELTALATLSSCAYGS